MTIQFFLTLILTIYSLNCFSQTTKISCTHASTCLLAKEIFKHNKEIKYEVLIKKMGDPHHFSPSQKQIKLILKSKNLIAPPLILQPWLKGLIKKKNSSEVILLEDNGLNIKGSKEALSHFWLYPQIICYYKKQLSKSIQKKWKGLKVNEIDCKKEDELHKKLVEISKPLSHQKLIITHDALTPLFSEFFNELLTLRSSHHGGSISPREAKRLTRFITSSKEPIMWIVEEQIHLPSRIKRKIRKSDKVIKLNTNLSHTDLLYSVIDKLLIKLGNQ